MRTRKAVGVVTPVEIVSVRAGETGVSATIMCVDSVGNKFAYVSSYFAFELEAYNPDQGMTFHNWSNKRQDYINGHPLKWRLDWQNNWKEWEEQYLNGVAFDDIPKLNKEF